MFSIAIVARFHELNHGTFHPAAGRTDENADRGRRLSFAIARIEHQQAVRFLTVIVASPLVSFLGHLWGKIGSGKVDGLGNRIDDPLFALVPIAFDAKPGRVLVSSAAELFRHLGDVDFAF